MNVKEVRKDFPILNQEKPPLYFDSACQSLRPKQVIDKINEYYNEYPACGGRSMHAFGKRVDEEVANARKIVQKFFNAKKSSEIIFTRNTTEGINLVVYSWPWKKGDVVVISDKEHNSNLIPWQLLKNKGVELKMYPFGNMEELKKTVEGATALATSPLSNADGSTQPAQELCKIAHDAGAWVLLDAAQAAPHQELDVKRLSVDFLVCSGHKMLGPSGTGILYGKEELLEKLAPFMTGGETVKESRYNSCVFEDLPHCFEAGLQNYAGIAGLGVAIKYLEKLGLSNISKHEAELTRHVAKAFETEPLSKAKMLGTAGSPIVSFVPQVLDVHHVALMLQETANIMVRSGMHCNHSWFFANNMPGSVRLSCGPYNTKEECDVFIDAVKKIFSTLA